jgi:hypothetical protein
MIILDILSFGGIGTNPAKDPIWSTWCSRLLGFSNKYTTKKQPQSQNKS